MHSCVVATAQLSMHCSGLHRSTAHARSLQLKTTARPACLLLELRVGHHLAVLLEEHGHVDGARRVPRSKLLGRPAKKGVVCASWGPEFLALQLRRV